MLRTTSLRGFVVTLSVILFGVLLAGLVVFLALAGRDRLNPLLVIFAIGLGLGLGYAAIIYYSSPFPAGWTWLSVVVGETLTESIETAVIFLFLYLAGLLPEYWWLLLAPWLAEAVGGVPMIVGQLWSFYDQHKENEKAENDYPKIRKSYEL